MRRPTYETAKDRRREGEVRKYVAGKWGVRATRLPQHAAADSLMERDGIMVGVCEIKTRNCTRWQYPTYLIGMQKIDKLATLGRLLRVKALLIVRWADGDTGYLVLDEARQPKVTMGGRRDRNDPADQELVAHFPIDWFRKV